MKSEGWNVTPLSGMRIQRAALFRFTPMTKVRAIKPSAAQNISIVKRAYFW